MAQDFMDGERISNKRGQHLYLWFSFPTLDQTISLPPYQKVGDVKPLRHLKKNSKKTEISQEKI